MLAPWKKSYDKPRQRIKKQRCYFASKGPSSQSYGFSSSHVWMWELDHKEGWMPENWCFWTVVLQKTLECPLDCREIKSANLKGNQSWIFTGRTDVEAEAPILWPPNAKNWLTGKDPDTGKDWGQEEKRMTEDEMVGWHHWLNGYEFEQAPGIGDGQGSLACCSPWSCRIRCDWATEQQSQWSQNSRIEVWPPRVDFGGATFYSDPQSAGRVQRGPYRWWDVPLHMKHSVSHPTRTQWGWGTALHYVRRPWHIVWQNGFSHFLPLSLSASFSGQRGHFYLC